MPKIVKKNGARRGALVLRRSAHDVWLAGLGALTLAEEEGGKLFKSLVKRGAVLESKNKDRIEKLVSRVKPMREDAAEALHKVGAGVDGSMAAVLHRLGVPTRKEIAGLTKRVEELTHSMERRRSPARKPAHRKAAATSPVV